MGLILKYVLVHESGRCSFRRAIPPKLRPYVPGRKREFKVSLGSQSDPDFLVRCRRATEEYDRIIDRARRQAEGAFDKLDGPRIAYLVEIYRSSALQEDDEARWSPAERELYKLAQEDLQQRTPKALAHWQGRERLRWAQKTRETLEWALGHQKRLKANGDLEGIVEFWEEEASLLIEAEELVVDPDDQTAFASLCRALNDVGISVCEDGLRRLDGEEVPTPPLPTPDPLGEPSRSQVARAPLMEIFEDYAADQGLTPGVRDEWRRYVRRLVDFLGHDDAVRLTAADLRNWRDLLLTEMTRKGTRREPVTVRDKYLTSVRATLAWAVEEQRLTANPAEHVTVRVPKKAKVRGSDFRPEEARAILAATLQPLNPHWSEHRRRACRWIPWLCAYTGGRVNEFSQLRGQDIYQEEGIWVVRITPEAGSVKTKEARVVPLHEHLIEQGFVKVAQENGPGPLFYDPGKQRVDREGSRHFKKVGERLAEWVRKEVGITDPAIKPNHAWRHLFKSISYEVGIEERMIDAIQGHAPTTTGRSYGRPSVRAKAEAIAKVPRFLVDVSK